MGGEKKEYFTVMNNAWGLLQPHVKDPAPYKKVMNELFVMFFKEIPDKFSDRWWQETADSFIGYANAHYNKPLGDFIGELVMGMLDYREYEYKLNKNTSDDFNKKIERAFTNERDRVTKGVSKEILSDPQGAGTSELQCADTVPEVGGCQEDDVPLKASDWG